MKSFTELLKSSKNFVHLKPADLRDIEIAEKKLALLFSKEYLEYLERYSLASADGHEYTGITTSPRLSVVEVTLRNWEQNPYASKSQYVVEETNMDGVVIWQDASGAVYQTSPNISPIKIAESLREYIEQ